ncbi:DUF1403 family protein [Aliiroseovarius sp. N1F302]|nr:DUF1403 family protein [Aliiroseovarius sediminis]MCI2393818.1 DUF1403 family protein [Aliiroseovarius sediminis]
MSHPHPIPKDAPAAMADTAIGKIPALPRWVTRARGETLEDVAFLSGATLGHLCLVARRDDLPNALWRSRLALGATEACMTIAGRSERVADLRDAVLFLRPGDTPDPAGAVCQSWQQAVSRPLSARNLQRALPDLRGDEVAHWVGAQQGAAVGRAADVLQAVLTDHPHAEHAALILADAALARAMGWDHVLPIFAAGLGPRDLRKTEDELRMACHRAVVRGAQAAIAMAADLARRASRLQAVAPKLRAKGAMAAVDMFLTRDAVVPAALPLPDRAARRFCDRLVTLGVARELSGRDTFRVYGV